MRRTSFLWLTILSLLAGAVTVFAFAPLQLWPIQLLSLAFLAWTLLRTQNKRQAFILGLAHGFGATGCGVYWLYVSLHVYGGMASAMAAFAVIMMALTLGSHTAVACTLAKWIINRWPIAVAPALLLVFPACWFLLEWVRGWLLTGLPWVVSGYAHTDSPLGGFAPILGVYGVGLLCAVCAGAIAFIFSAAAHTRKKTIITSGVLIAVIMGIGSSLRIVNWTSPYGNPVQVRLLQGNVAQELKFSPDQIRAQLGLYAQMITHRPADLIATPETAIPLPPHMLPVEYLPHLAGFAKSTNSRIALGIPIIDSSDIYTNSMIVMPGNTPNIVANYRYDKHHLVPFGEFIPFGFRWFVAMMRMPLGDFTRGNALQSPFTVADQYVMPDICYEDLFGEEIAAQIRNEHQAGRQSPTILLNMTNIAWFGPTIALPQHLQIARMRAMETARPMLRATNTGTTAIIDTHGHIIAQLPPYTQGEIHQAVQGVTGLTPYIYVGNYAAVFLSIIMLIAAIWITGRKYNH